MTPREGEAGAPNPMLKAHLTARGKQPRKKGQARSMKEIINTVGPALLADLAKKGPEEGSIDLYRAMHADEARGLREYWSGPKPQQVDEYVADEAPDKTTADFKARFGSMATGSHFADHAQGHTFHKASPPDGNHAVML
ncbi:hypothetical protein G3I76_16605, partial [Streptomyces sp. SID11233]|nr:hypothetical protein [Streptomyces sp. SID11233]